MKIKIGHFGTPHDTHGARYYLHIDPEARSVCSFSASGSEVPAEAFHGLTVLVPVSVDLHVLSLVEVLKGEEAQATIRRIVALYEGRSEGTSIATEGTEIGTWGPGLGEEIVNLQTHIDRLVPLDTDEE